VSDETGMKAHTLFTATYIHAAPRDAVLTSIRRPGLYGASATKGSGLCRIVQMDF
jgi:hypothetical protein